MGHQAVALLPASGGKLTLKWRVVQHANEPVGKFQALHIKSNVKDKPHDGPPHFTKYKLRKEQLRSLAWMMEQECSQEHFLEEDVVEAPLNQLGWRLECKVTHAKLVKGGILADQVGYGKTAIILGLIDSMPQEVPKDTFGHIHRLLREQNSLTRLRISVKATLIIVPSHLTTQWTNEVKKFLGTTYKVITLESETHLQKLTVADFEEVDIIVCSKDLYQDESKSNPAYYSALGFVTGSAEYPSKPDRQFESVSKYVCPMLKLAQIVEQLKIDFDPEKLLAQMKQEDEDLREAMKQHRTTTERDEEKKFKTVARLKQQIDVAIAKAEERKKLKSKGTKKLKDDDEEEEEEEVENDEENEEEEDSKQTGPKKAKTTSSCGLGSFKDIQY